MSGIIGVKYIKLMIYLICYENEEMNKCTELHLTENEIVVFHCKVN